MCRKRNSSNQKIDVQRLGLKCIHLSKSCSSNSRTEQQKYNPRSYDADC